LVFTVQCSVNRKGKSYTKGTSIETESGSILEKVVKQNITGSNFFIEKAEFSINSAAGEKDGIGTIKFMLPDKYLVSLKSKAGIEIARIYLTEDSVMINDRLNKKLYYGSASDMKRKYGLTTSILPVILGDFINDLEGSVEKPECKDGFLNMSAVIKDIRIKYSIDCKYGKCIQTLPANELKTNGFKIEYTDFINTGGINIPGKISISEKQNNTRIEIKILKIVIPWEGSIEFIPGRQYEKIHLL
jgi:hypothetical protein